MAGGPPFSTKADVRRSARVRAERDRRARHVADALPIQYGDKPLRERIAHAICDRVYAGGCTCKQFPRMAVCSTMNEAAASAMRLMNGEKVEE